MPAACIMSEDEVDAFRESAEFPDYYPNPQLYEEKTGEWAILKGRPVIIDYALRAHLEPQDIDLRVRTLDDAMKSVQIIPR